MPLSLPCISINTRVTARSLSVHPTVRTARRTTSVRYATCCSSSRSRILLTALCWCVIGYLAGQTKARGVQEWYPTPRWIAPPLPRANLLGTSGRYNIRTAGARVKWRVLLSAISPYPATVYSNKISSRRAVLAALCVWPQYPTVYVQFRQPDSRNWCVIMIQHGCCVLTA